MKFESYAEFREYALKRGMSPGEAYQAWRKSWNNAVKESRKADNVSDVRANANSPKR